MPLQIHQTPFIIEPKADLLTRHPHLKHASQSLARHYADSKTLITDDQLKQIGGELWRVLEQDERFTLAKTAAGGQILPIILKSDQPAVQQLPWETLYHPADGFLGRNPAFTLSRDNSAAPHRKRAAARPHLHHPAGRPWGPKPP